MSVVDWLIRRAEKRQPDFTIRQGDADSPIYLKRWWLIPRNPFLNVYLHHILLSDDARALHDHPWVNMSIILRGGYIEHVPGPRSWIPSTYTRKAGDVVLRMPRALHRLELHWDDEVDWRNSTHRIVRHEKPCWTLFITGPRLRVWGFSCPQGWVPWTTFVQKTPDGNGSGRGCD